MTKGTIQKAVRMPCHPKFLQEVRRVLSEALTQAEVPRRKRDLIILAVDEAVSSVVQYARFKGYDHDISLEIDINDVRFRAVLNDTLNTFDFNADMSEKQLADQVRISPSRRGTFGSHPSPVFARVMSGRRCLGSSWGRSR